MAEAAAFSHDGEFLASSSTDGHLRVWRVASNQLQADYKGTLADPTTSFQWRGLVEAAPEKKVLSDLILGAVFYFPICI